MDNARNEITVQQISAETLAEHLAPLLEQYDVRWRGHGFIYVDHEPYNIETFHKILAGLSTSLGVPTQQVRARLVECGWLNDVRVAHPVREEAVPVADTLDPWLTDSPEDDDPEMNEEYGRD